jgi:hypothetical protein
MYDLSYKICINPGRVKRPGLIIVQKRFPDRTHKDNSLLPRLSAYKNFVFIILNLDSA